MALWRRIICYDMRMRRLRAARNVGPVCEPSPISGSILCTVYVDRAGYVLKDCDEFEVVETDAETPKTYRARQDPLTFPELWQEEEFENAELFLDGPFLVPQQTLPRRGHTAHDPLAIEGLHVEFAEIRGPVDALRFANSYGLLGYAYALESTTMDATQSGLILGESLEFWMHHVGTVRMFRALWPLVATKDNVRLERYVNRFTEGDQPDFSSIAIEELANEFTLQTTSARVYGTFEHGPVIPEPAKVDEAPAWQLAYDRIHLALNLELRASTRIHVQPPDPNPYVIVTDLLGAIYWQLAREMMGVVPRAQFCQHCHSLIKNARVDAKFCSTSCRQKAFQLKKKQGNQS